jgi:hypothetical protein
VNARLNDLNPTTTKYPPINMAEKAANKLIARWIGKIGNSNEAPYMPNAVISAKIGGGIVFSSLSILLSSD